MFYGWVFHLYQDTVTYQELFFKILLKYSFEYVILHCMWHDFVAESEFWFKL